MKTVMSIVLGIALILSTGIVFAQDTVTDSGDTTINAALEGYCPVHVFNGKLRKGSSEFSVAHNGQTYIFASQVQLDMFAQNPDLYVDGLEVKFADLKDKVARGAMVEDVGIGMDHSDGMEHRAPTVNSEVITDATP